MRHRSPLMRVDLSTIPTGSTILAAQLLIVRADPKIVDDRDPISYLYTSGTTSTPKGVVSSHLAVYLESLGVALETRMTANDRITVAPSARRPVLDWMK